MYFPFRNAQTRLHLRKTITVKQTWVVSFPRDALAMCQVSKSRTYSALLYIKKSRVWLTRLLLEFYELVGRTVELEIAAAVVYESIVNDAFFRHLGQNLLQFPLEKDVIAM